MAFIRHKQSELAYDYQEGTYMDDQDWTFDKGYLINILQKQNQEEYDQ